MPNTAKDNRITISTHSPLYLPSKVHGGRKVRFFWYFVVKGPFMSVAERHVLPILQRFGLVIAAVCPQAQWQDNILWACLDGVQ